MEYADAEREYGALLRSIAVKYQRGLTANELDDLLQEAAVILVNASPRLRVDSNPATYLAKVVRTRLKRVKSADTRQQEIVEALISTEQMLPPDPFGKPVEDGGLARVIIREVYARLDNRERKVFREMLFPNMAVIKAMQQRHIAANRRKRRGETARAANRGVQAADIAKGTGLKYDYVTRAVRRIRFYLEELPELPTDGYSVCKGASAPCINMPERRHSMATRKPSLAALTKRAEELGITWEGEATADELAQWIAEEEAALQQPAPVTTDDLPPNAGAAPPAGDNPCKGTLYDAAAEECKGCAEAVECAELMGGGAAPADNTCVACGGTGQSSTGRRCVACQGTGQAQGQPAPAAPEVSRYDQLLARATELFPEGWDGDPTEDELAEWIADEEKAQGITPSQPDPAAPAAGAVPDSLKEFVGKDAKAVDRAITGKDLRVKLKAAGHDPTGMRKPEMVALTVELCGGAAPAAQPATGETLLEQAQRLIPGGWDGDPTDAELEQWIEEEGETPVTKQAAPASEPEPAAPAAKRRAATQPAAANPLHEKAKQWIPEGWDGDPTDDELTKWIHEAVEARAAELIPQGWDGDPTTEELEQWIAEEEAALNPKPVDPAAGEAGESPRKEDANGKALPHPDDCFGDKNWLDLKHPDCMDCRVIKRCAKQCGVSLKGFTKLRKEAEMAKRKQPAKKKAAGGAKRRAASAGGAKRRAASGSKTKPAAPRQSMDAAAEFTRVHNAVKRLKLAPEESHGGIVFKLKAKQCWVGAVGASLKMHTGYVPKADVGRVGKSKTSDTFFSAMPHTIRGNGNDIMAHIKALM